MSIQKSFDDMHEMSGCQFEKKPNIDDYLEHLDVDKFLKIILGVKQLDPGYAKLAAWLIMFWIMDDALEQKKQNAYENASKWIQWCSEQNEYGPILYTELNKWLEGTQEEHELKTQNELKSNYMRVRTKSAGVCPTFTAMFVFVPSRRQFFENISVEQTRSFILKLTACSFLVGIDNDRQFSHKIDVNLSKSLTNEELNQIEQKAVLKHKNQLRMIAEEFEPIYAKEAASYRERFQRWASNAPRYNKLMGS